MDIDAAQITAGSLHGARLNFFDDAAFVLNIHDVQSRNPDCFTASGTIADDPRGQFVVAAENGAFIANIWTGAGTAFQLRPTTEPGSYLAEELDMSRLGECACGPAERPELGHLQQEVNTASGQICPATIDVLIAYTDQARATIGGDNAVRALANACIASTNLAYVNSGVLARARAIRIAAVSYDESNDFNTDLLRLRIHGDGFLDEVQGLRNDCGADAVCMLVGSNSSCGIAYVMSTPSPSFESLAYSVVSVNCAVSSLSFAHELGHNLGCEHNPGSGTGAFLFAHGHRFFGQSGTQWRTVMSNSPGLRIAHFSNPEINYDGAPTGVPDASNNARCINGTSGIVSAFRTASIVDCNGNSQDDACDIAGQTSTDLNENGVPDECDSPDCPVPASTDLTAESPRALDNFGASIAMSRDGTRFVAGSALADDQGMNSGAVDVFDRADGIWMHTARLTASDGFVFQQFGRSVAMSPDGNWLAIGAPRDGLTISDVGAVYIFQHDAGRWTQSVKLVPPDPVQGDFFGFSVAISAAPFRVAIGSPFNDQGGPQSGSVYVFRQEPNGWALEAEFVGLDAAADSEFGFSVSMDDGGERILVGARSDDHVHLNAGAAYVFVRTANSWIQEARASIPQMAAGDRLGTSVALAAASGDVAVVGAPRHDAAGLDAGAVWTLLRTGSNWTIGARTDASDGAMGRLFGTSVAITATGDMLVVGTPFDVTTFSPNNQGVISGSACVFVRNANRWEQFSKLRSIDSAANDNLGSAVAVTGVRSSATAVVGSILDDVAGEVDAGSIRVFEHLTAEYDCNGNGLPDSCDIMHGISLDADHNSRPDECDRGACPADIAGVDGTINIDDLTLVITSWGLCGLPCQTFTCAADVNHDCAVDIDDLVAIITHWGPCAK